MVATIEKTEISTWKLDPNHSTVEFSAKHMMLTTVRGRFTGFDATVHLDEDNITNSTVEANIDAATLNSNVDYRDNHLRSADFLDVENHPTITFKSTRIEPVGETRFRLVGDLTIRGVTNEVVLDTTLEGYGTSPYGAKVAGFTATTKINRKDWGLNWNVALEKGGLLVGEKINIELNIQLAKQEASTPELAA